MAHFTHKSKCKSILTTRVRADLILRVQARVCALHISAFKCYALSKFQFHQMNFFCLLNIWYPFNKSILNCEWVNCTTRINICEISWYYYYYHCYIIPGILTGNGLFVMIISFLSFLLLPCSCWLLMSREICLKRPLKKTQRKG